MDVFNFSEHFFAEDLNDEKLIQNTIRDLYSLKEMEPESDGRSNNFGWQKNGIHNLQIMDPIKPHITKFVNSTVEWVYSEYTSEKEREDQNLHWVISIENIFANINGKGSYHVMHQHGGANYSGVLYLQTPKDGGDIYLQAPFHSPWMNLLPIPAIQDYYRQITPYPGLMILFPAYMLHHVDKNRSNKDRIAISFNVNVCYSSDVYHAIRKT